MFISAKTNQIIMVRDHFGCQPIYYYCDANVLIFGSNIPDIIKNLPTSIQYNSGMLSNLFGFNQVYSDETYYQNIYRSEPGSILRIMACGSRQKKLFWQLDPNASDLVLGNKKSYLDRFDELMSESILFNSQTNEDLLAGELSGGLDSSAILTAAKTQHLEYPLFMHVAPAGSLKSDDLTLAEMILKHFNHSEVSLIDATNFDPLLELDYCSKIFAGCAPYLFFMLSQNINRAVVSSKKKVLLSGAGGDECVSGYASFSNLLASIRQNQSLYAMWKRLAAEQRNSDGWSHIRRLKKYAQFVKLSNPYVYKAISTLTRQANCKYPMTIRANEWNLLQGPASQSIRMRIEYSSVLAESMGYEYRYPLLYPKLVEFCYHLPSHQKNHRGIGRYLIREYLKRHGIPSPIYQKIQKNGGIIPATLDKFEQYRRQGKIEFNAQLSDYLRPGQYLNQHQKLVAAIHAYMYTNYQSQLAGS